MQKSSFRLLVLISFFAFGAFGCSEPIEPNPQESASAENVFASPPARKVAEPGDVQIAGLQPGMESVNIRFSTRIPMKVFNGSTGQAERFVQMYFTAIFLGPMTTNAGQVPDEIIGQKFDPGMVRLEISSRPGAANEKGVSTLYENRIPIILSKSAPNILRVDAFKKMDQTSLEHTTVKFK